MQWLTKNIIHSNNSKSEQIENIDNYDIDDIFKNKKETKTNAVTENIIEKEPSIIEYKEEGLFKKFLNKILSFFINKKERG